jgi:cytochrome c peroxidase
MRKSLGIVLVFFLAMSACRKEDPVLVNKQSEPYKLNLPAHFPMPEIPEDNALTIPRVELGKKLFFDSRLSANGSVSCGSCHLQDLAFADNIPLSEGINGRTGKRNSPPLFNLAWHDRLMGDGGVPNLELQVLVPLHDENEMASNILDISEELNEIEAYREMARVAYGSDMSPFVITHSIAAFERTLISGNSRYDQYINGDTQALNSSEIRGMDLFFSERTSCGSCHGGFLLKDQDYHNIGLSEEYEDIGRELVSLDPMDRGKFKTPSLRNIAVTAPYMHDGSMNSLMEVVEHFNNGGADHPIKDPRIRELNLSEQEKLDLVNFMGALTDDEFLVNPEFKP